MRLRELHLARFGHFTDRRFDFGAADGRPDFHIIHGLNEAGKTTTMEAILRLFFGFPKRERYAFRHQRANLSVSANLEIVDGARKFTRLPTRSGSLVDEAGTALPESALAMHLGGLLEADYRNLLCLDDDTIESGGEEIAQARGDMGRLLFSAAAGVANLSIVLDKVREEADALWRKRASTTRMAKLKRERAAVEKSIRDRNVTAGQWRGLKKALSDRETEEVEARAARDRLHLDAARVAARGRAFPHLTEIDRLECQIVPFADFPAQLDFDPERLVDLLKDDVQVRADAKRLARKIAEMTEEKEAIHRAPDRLTLSENLDVLEDLRSRDATARMDLDRRRGMVADQEAIMIRAARDLDATEGTDPRALVLSSARIAKLEAARDALHGANNLTETESREVTDLVERFAEAQKELEAQAAEAPPEKDPGEILARHDADRLASAWAKAQQAIETAESDFRTALETLARGAVTFDALPDCPVTAAQAKGTCVEHDTLARQIEQVEDALGQHRETAAAREAEAEQLTRSGAVVSDADADALQAERERLWQVHRETLTEASADPFEATMRQLDGVMQGRLAQARDLGQLRQIEQARAEAKARAKKTAKRLDKLSRRREDLAGRIDATASGLGLPVPIPPDDWFNWIVAHVAAEEAQRALEHTRTTHADTLERADRLVEALHPLVGLEDPQFDAALSRARDLAMAARQQTEAVTRAKDARDRIETDLTRRRSRLKKAKKAAVDALRDWETIVTDLLGGRVAPETLLASFKPLRELREAEALRAEIARRVTTMEADRKQFAAEVAVLAAAHGLPEKETPAETFAELRARAREAEEAETDFARFSDGIETADGERRGCQIRLDNIVAEQQAIGRIFPEGIIVDTIEDLRKATDIARRVIDDRATQADHEAALLLELSVPDLDAARTQLKGADPASLEAEAARLTADLEIAETALTRATEARVAARQALSQVTGDAEFAALGEHRAVLDLQMEEVALEHLELHLGHRLAEEAIRRYRDAHRSGMMAATERSFATLTRDAYTQLKSQPEGDGEALLAVDSGGTAKRVAEMSKSTRFQLYLALRAAAYEQLVTQGICLPFFCDDIFETFDEERTSAACRVMEQIGRKGQAIYLTHHRHVLDIAEIVCDTAPMVHEL